MMHACKFNNIMSTLTRVESDMYEAVDFDLFFCLILYTATIKMTMTNIPETTSIAGTIMAIRLLVFRPVRSTMYTWSVYMLE